MGKKQQRRRAAKEAERLERQREALARESHLSPVVQRDRALARSLYGHVPALPKEFRK